MLIKLPKPSDCQESDVTPESLYFSRRGLLGGALAVVVCAFLAATYLTADADSQGLADLTEYFRRRALAAGIAAGIVAAIGVGVLHADASRLFAHLTGRAFPLLVLSGVGGTGTLLLLLRRGRYAVARVTAAVAVVAVLWGWAAGQYPFLIDGRLTIAAGQGAHATLQALLGAVIVGLVVVVPALAWLLLLTRRGALSSTATGEVAGRNSSG